MPGEDTHALKAQLAAAYVEIGAVRDANAKMGQRMRDAEAERDDARAIIKRMAGDFRDESDRRDAAESERDAIRADVKRLREAFMGLRETYGLVLAFAREVLGVLERGEDSHVLRVPDRTMKLLRCTDPIPTADDVVSDARAALAAPAAGEEGKHGQ